MLTLELSAELPRGKVWSPLTGNCWSLSLYVGAGCAGPMTQNEFLHKMGIRQRLQVTHISGSVFNVDLNHLLLLQALLDKASPSDTRDLLSGYEMLTSPEKMGHRYKFLTITSSPSHIPTPFVAGMEPFPSTPRTTDSSSS